jgi:hypothetical protein
MRWLAISLSMTAALVNIVLLVVQSPQTKVPYIIGTAVFGVAAGLLALGGRPTE